MEQQNIKFLALYRNISCVINKVSGFFPSWLLIWSYIRVSREAFTSPVTHKLCLLTDNQLWLTSLTCSPPMMWHSIGQLTKHEMIIVFLPVRSGLLLNHTSAGEHRPKETIFQMSSMFGFMDTMSNKAFDIKWEDNNKAQGLKWGYEKAKKDKSDRSCVNGWEE